MLISQPSASLVLWIFLLLGTQHGTIARENTGEIRASCEKGMQAAAATAPYPYPLVYINNYGISGQFLCDTTTDGGGWILTQRRSKGDVSFERGWEDYKTGFGSLHTDYWMGLDNIHNLTNSGHYELRIDIQTKSETAFAHYSSFSVSSESDNYVLSIGSHDGTALDSLREHNGAMFSTLDRDNDLLEIWDCADLNHGGWWFTSTDCDEGYLNGRWGVRHSDNEWKKLIRYGYPALLTEMKIRRVEN